MTSRRVQLVLMLVTTSLLWLGGTAFADGDCSHDGDHHDATCAVTVTVNGDVNLSYRVIGDGAQDVVLVHGWMVSGKVFDDFIAEIQSPELRIIVPDLRGTGDSDEPMGGYTLERYSKDVRAVIEDADAKDYILVGHSMGGQIAQITAAKEGDYVKGLLLFATVPLSGMQLPPDAWNLFYNSGENRTLQGIILSIATLELTPEATQRLLDDAGTISVRVIQKSLEAWTTGGDVELLDRITAPTVVVASDDPFLPPAFLQAAVVDLIAGAQLVYMSGPGHYITVERPAESAIIFNNLLDSL